MINDFKLIEYSVVIEQTIEQIEIIKSILENKYKIQVNLINKWLNNLKKSFNCVIDINESILLNGITLTIGVPF